MSKATLNDFYRKVAALGESDAWTRLIEKTWAPMLDESQKALARLDPFTQGHEIAKHQQRIAVIGELTDMVERCLRENEKLRRGGG